MDGGTSVRPGSGSGGGGSGAGASTVAITSRQQRAWSTLEIKAVNDDERIIEGIASTPSTDRMGDIVEPDGATFKLPLPLLWQHDAGQPIGNVVSAKVGKGGISIRAQLVRVDEPGTLKDRLDEAWQSIKAGLVRGLSIGFMPLESAQIEGTWGMRFLKWEWFELSAVTIPANAEASITAIKAVDQKTRAASGKALPVVHLTSSPGASGKTTPKGQDMTYAERIAQFEAKRAANVAQMEAIQKKASDEGRSKDEAEREQFATYAAENEGIDGEIADLKVLEKQAVANAARVAVEDGTEPKRAAESRGKGNFIRVESNLAKGIPFVRYVKALVQAKGMPYLALQVAEANQQWKDTSPEVALCLKAMVTKGNVVAGDTTTAGWASELVYNQNLVSAFLEYLRPQTILGKIEGFTRVPFNVRYGTQTGASTGYWVGQGKPIPMSKLTTGSSTLGIAKAAGMVVLDKELIMSSDPSAEVLVRNDLGKTIAQFLDVNFIAPDYAAVANVNPASITNGVDPTAASGTAATNFLQDSQTLFQNFDVNNLEGGGFFWVTTPKIARAISLMRTSLGEPLYPTVTPEGGTYLGYPLIVSGSAMQVGSPVTGEGNLLVLGHAPSINMADEGGLVIDASEEASVQMLDNPTNDTVTPTATSMVSMWQTGCVALRAIRFINWSKRRTFAVSYIKDAAYVAT